MCDIQDIVLINENRHWLFWK